MIYKVCAVHDKAVEAFGQPFYVVNKGAALRGFGDECKRVPSPDRPNPFFGHLEDYSLYYLGDFDDNTGRFDMRDIPERLAEATDFRG